MDVKITDERLLHQFSQNIHLKQSTKNKYIRIHNDIATNFFPEQQPYTILHCIYYPQVFLSKLNTQKPAKKVSAHWRMLYVDFLLSVLRHTQLAYESIKPQIFETIKGIKLRFKEEIDLKYKTRQPSKKQERGFVPYEELFKIYENTNPIRQHYERLLFGLYILIPPVRADYGNVLILNDKRDTKHLSKEQSFLIHTTKTSVMHVRQFKTNKTYGNIITDLPRELHKDISDSLKVEPRTHLFPLQTHRDSFRKWANRKLKIHVNNNNFTLTRFRNAYVIHFLCSKHKDAKAQSSDFFEHQAMAAKMGNSVQTQMEKYNWHK
jgi:hypothetical protein